MAETVKPRTDDDGAAFAEAVTCGIAPADAGQIVASEDARRWLLS